jgi:glycosyltransferase involved in cell wall biosynthesis
MRKSSLIILTRNEIHGLRTLIAAIPTRGVTECFAVDYRSTDGTVELFKKNKIRVIHQDTPGRGEAFRLAAEAATGDDLIFFSPDGNEDPADIPRLLRCLHRGNDLVIASRFMKGSKNEEDDQPIKFRAWANRLFTLIANLCFHGHVTDSINGYRAITKTAFNSLHLTAGGFALEYQMTIRSLKLGYKIVEFPTRESPRIGGQSTAYAIPTGLKVLSLLIREILIGTQF